MRKYYITVVEVFEARKLQRKQGIGWVEGKYNVPVLDEDIALMSELNAMEMIHTFIAYHPLVEKNEWHKDAYFCKHLEALGFEKLQTLIDLAVERVESVECAYIDSEGYSCNHITWKE